MRKWIVAVPYVYDGDSVVYELYAVSGKDEKDAVLRNRGGSTFQTAIKTDKRRDYGLPPTVAYPWFVMRDEEGESLRDRANSSRAVAFVSNVGADYGTSVLSSTSVVWKESKRQPRVWLVTEPNTYLDKDCLYLRLVEAETEEGALCNARSASNTVGGILNYGPSPSRLLMFAAASPSSPDWTVTLRKSDSDPGYKVFPLERSELARSEAELRALYEAVRDRPVKKTWIVAEQRRYTEYLGGQRQTGVVWIVNLVSAPNKDAALMICNQNTDNSEFFMYASVNKLNVLGTYDPALPLTAVEVPSHEWDWKNRDPNDNFMERLQTFARSCSDFLSAGLTEEFVPDKPAASPAEPPSGLSTSAAVSAAMGVAIAAPSDTTVSFVELNQEMSTMSKLSESIKSFASQTRDDAAQGAKIAAGIKATKFLQRIITTRVVPRLPAFVEGYATEAVNSVYGGAVVSFLGGVALPHITTRFLDDKPQAYVEQTAKTMREQAFAGVFVELADLVGDELADFFTKEQRAAEREARRASEREAAQLQERTGVRAEHLFGEAPEKVEKANEDGHTVFGHGYKANGASHSS